MNESPEKPSSEFRFGDSTPTPRPAYKITVITPGQPEKVVTILGHVPLSAAMFNAGLHKGGVARIEAIEV